MYAPSIRPLIIDFVTMIRSLQPRAQLCCGTTLQRRAMKLYDVNREAIDQKLAMLDSKISIALDLWTSPAQMPFFGLVGHFIDEDWVPRTLLIDFAHLPGSHTGERIYEVTSRYSTNVLEQYRTNHNIDNSFDIRSALRMFYECSILMQSPTQKTPLFAETSR